MIPETGKSRNTAKNTATESVLPGEIQLGELLKELEREQSKRADITSSNDATKSGYAASLRQ